MPTPDDLKWATRDLESRDSDYETWSEYYRGKHELAFATRKWRKVFGTLFRRLQENLCRPVVDVLCDRLKLLGCNQAAPAPTIADELNRVWRLNRMDKRAIETHREALRSGDAYVVVWPDDAGVPRVHGHRARAVTVQRDPENPDRIVLAAQFFQFDDRAARKTVRRCNLYYPDRVEKYVAGGGVWTPWDGPGGPVVPNPYGQVPVFHFANNADIGEFGTSELASVVPLQDALNKALADLMIGSEYQSFRQRWVTGLEIDLDPKTGLPVNPWNPEVQRFVTAADPDVKFGEFSASDLQNLVTMQDSLRQAVARVSGTPMHFFMLGQNYPSGESLKVAESRLTAKVADRQVSFGNVWEDVFRFCLKVRGFDADLDANWEDTTPRNALDLANTGNVKRGLGVSTRQILREQGYSDTQIATIETERAAEDAAARDALAQQANFA